MNLINEDIIKFPREIFHLCKYDALVFQQTERMLLEVETTIEPELTAFQ